MSDILDEVRKAERDALSPSNKDFYKRCGDEIESLRKAHVGANVGAGWQPIGTAPKDGTEFAAYEEGDVYKCHWKEYDDGEGRFSEGWYDHVNETLENPTHWMPLPAVGAHVGAQAQQSKAEA